MKDVIPQGKHDVGIWPSIELECKAHLAAIEAVLVIPLTCAVMFEFCKAESR